MWDARVDVRDDSLMRSRSWPWLAARITGVINAPFDVDGSTGMFQYRTRLQQELARQGVLPAGLPQARAVND